ncbi:MAG: family 43 glycosylhydrolase [Lentisphaeria bacterium]|nr:family 43 glycosylhydrolase [Lentisphaeria bacterium]
MKKIVFFGDSTLALREKNVTAFELFQRNFPQHTVSNCAAEAETTETARARFGDILAQKPDAVVLSFGLDDAWIEPERKENEPRVPLARYLENLRFFFAELRKIGAFVIFLAPLPMVLTIDLADRRKAGPCTSQEFNRQLDLYREEAEKCAGEAEVAVVPADRFFRERELILYRGLSTILPDGIHPNDLGQEWLYRLICETLQRRSGFFPGRCLHSFRPGEIWPDDYGIHINAHGGGLLKHGNGWYWYGEHKIAGDAGNLAHVGVHVYFSDDLYNWHDCGIAFDIRTCSRMVPGVNVIERPKVLFCAATGKFVMWFHFENQRPYSAAEVGVAVSDRPEGPFILQNHFRPCQGGKALNPPGPDEITRPDEPDHLRQGMLLGHQSRDLTLFQDDDGKAYLFHASELNRTMHVVELTPDYLNCSPNFWRIFPRRFMEAPAVFKKDGLYYFIGSGCTGWAPNAARSAVAPHPWGPWRELGNPAVDEGAETTYESQSTFVLEYHGRYILMSDRWCPKNAIDGRYLWMPIEFEDGRPIIRKPHEWSL